MQKTPKIADPAALLRSEFETHGGLTRQRLTVLERLSCDERMQDVWNRFLMNLKADISRREVGLTLRTIALVVVNTYATFSDRDRILLDEEDSEKKAHEQIKNAQSLSVFVRGMRLDSEGIELFKPSDSAPYQSMVAYNKRLAVLADELEWLVSRIDATPNRVYSFLFSKSQKWNSPTGFAVMLSGLLRIFLQSPMHSQVATITEVVFPGICMTPEAVRKALARERHKPT